LPTSRPEAAAGLTRRELVERSLAVGASLAFPLDRFVPAIRDGDPRLRSLERTVRGAVVGPGDARYERDRLVFCARYDGIRPLAVAHPVDAADVSAVVRWARREGVHIAARSGGHSYGGYSTTDGVVVDLSRLAGVRVGGTRAVVGPGTRLGVIYDALGRHGQAIPAGTCPSVGIGGHALGGGFGLASRAWGLASDNVVSAEIVTADGAVLVVDEHRHPDLYWACRGGGGGNFGIVTRLVFRTHPVRQGSFFVGTWPWAQVEELLAAYLRWAPSAPDALGSVCRLATGPGGPSVQVFGQFLGSERRLQALLAGLRPAASRLEIGTASWLDLVRRWAGCLGHTLPGCSAPGHQVFVGASDYIGRVPSPAELHAFREVVEHRGAAPGALLIDAYGGVLNRIPTAATAFPHRHELASIQYFASGDAASARAWVTSSRAALAHAVSGAAYVNYIDPALRHWEQAYYGANLPRLQRIKRRHDPHNVFHFAQSIRLH
jgi:FAD/FMN-containing dehydrogenase